MTMSKWLKRICEHWNDKKLAEKCGLPVKEICVHEATFVMTHLDGKTHTCIKCGAYYDEADTGA